MQRGYELMFIIRPDADDEGIAEAIQSVHRTVEGLGGEILRTTPWGKRRLAYEVSHLRDGYYVLVNLMLDAGKVADLQRVLRIHDTIFRHLLVLQEGEVVPESPEERAAATASRRPEGADSGSERETETPADETPNEEKSPVAAGVNAEEAE